jgi:hypothetical protein
MSKDEIKYEINKVLNQFSSEALQELLIFLKQVEQKQSPTILDSSHLQKILSEDNELLQRLAK